MDVRFSSRALARCYANSHDAERAWGRAVATQYVQRVNLLYAAESLQELFTYRTLRLHPLIGDRAPQYSMTLHGRWRLIITPLPSQPAVIIEEVTNHYGD